MACMSIWTTFVQPCSIHSCTCTGSTSRTSNYYGVGIGPVQVATVQCSGTETNLRDCSLAVTSTCGQSPNAGVTCVGMSDMI